MKCVVTSSGKTLDSPLDSRFGRANYFILIDTESGSLDAYGNSLNLNAAQGAGIQAAEMASKLGAQVVITGHCGPKAFQTLQAAGIQVAIGAEGTVGDAIEAFQSGRLKLLETSDVEGHWA